MQEDGCSYMQILTTPFYIRDLKVYGFLASKKGVVLEPTLLWIPRMALYLGSVLGKGG